MTIRILDLGARARSMVSLGGVPATRPVVWREPRRGHEVRVERPTDLDRQSDPRTEETRKPEGAKKCLSACISTALASIPDAESAPSNSMTTRPSTALAQPRPSR